MIVLLLMYTVTVMPFSMAFAVSSEADGWLVVDLAIDALFFLDILVNCSSAHYDSEGTLVTRRSTIFCQYAKS